MYRRIYFLFPAVEHAQRVVVELKMTGISRDHIHAVARPGIDLSTLPAATSQQKSDAVWRVERLFWIGNLILFAAALIGFIATLFSGAYIWSAVTVILMLASFLSGRHFAVNLPHVHLSDIRGGLSRGEILLMVDVPKKRLAELERLVLRHHPEAGTGGIGWTIEALGI
jgi:hypothetical protein